MKNIIIIITSILLILLSTSHLTAQSPQKMSFQAVIRNINNVPVSMSTIGIRISVIYGSPEGIAVYTETQNGNTNSNGLISLQIGTGKVMVGTFASIDWANGPFFIKTETDPNGGNDYTIVGTSELLSVPYALFALNTHLNDHIGTSYEKMDLSSLKIGQIININMTKGVDFYTAGHILISSTGDNHFEGSFLSYNKVTGLLSIEISEVIGSGSYNFWNIDVNAVRGYNGSPGAVGIAGLDGSVGLNGTNGDIGLTGVAGTDGLPGVKGDIGLSGLAGTDGLPGVKGDIGLSGADGLAGIKGDIGLNGRDGLNGTIGIDGLNGTNGLPGVKGDIGLTGADGIDAINGEPLITSGTTSQYYRGDKTWQTLNSIVVGLNNVNNTSDLNKIISTATQSALDLKSAINSPTFTGMPLAPTAEVANNTQQIATTEFVLANTDKYISVSTGDLIFTTSTTDVLATGLNFSPAPGNYIVHFNGEYLLEPLNRTGLATTDLNAAYTSLMAEPVTVTHSVAYGAGEILLAGVYKTTGAVTSTGTLTLDAQNNPNAKFIFQFDAAFSTGAGFKVILVNGALACNVYWIAEGAIALGAGTVMKGILISNAGAITIGSGSILDGSLYTKTGAIGIDASSISAIANCGISLSTLVDFAVFSQSGAITNVGNSNITGDIASNSGSVGSFATATLNGSIITAGLTNALATFSIYQNGLLIPFSSRKRNSNFNIGEINLQAIATVAAGENIEVRWKVDAGKIKLQNRIFTIQSVR